MSALWHYNLPSADKEVGTNCLGYLGRDWVPELGLTLTSSGSPFLPDSCPTSQDGVPALHQGLPRICQLPFAQICGPPILPLAIYSSHLGFSLSFLLFLQHIVLPPTSSLLSVLPPDSPRRGTYPVLPRGSTFPVGFPLRVPIFVTTTWL